MSRDLLSNICQHFGKYKLLSFFRQIIKCTVALGILLIALGVGLFVLFLFFREGKKLGIFLCSVFTLNLISDPNYWFVNPFSVIGITITVCGLMFVGFSIEACIQLKQNLSRVQDPEIDDITNLHHIKHWIEPGMCACT